MKTQNIEVAKEGGKIFRSLLTARVQKVKRKARIEWEKVMVEMASRGLEPSEEDRGLFLDDLPLTATERHDEAYQEALEKVLKGVNLGSEALEKSCLDSNFDYALRLRTGEVIRFIGAAVLPGGAWVRLTLKEPAEQPTQNRVAFLADRGMDVRVSDIVWVMDAPEGS